MTNQRSYYTIMPSRILSDTRLTPTARIVYGVIENLARRTGECYAGNDYITTSMGDMITDRTLRRAMEILEDCGYIQRELRIKKGSQNERIIKISSDWKTAGLLNGGTDKNVRTDRTKMSALYNDEKQSIKRFSLTRMRADEIFKNIWITYTANRRGSEKKAYDAYIQAITIHQADAQKILDVIPKYLNSEEVQDKKKKQYLSNWLENGGYNTEYVPAKPKPVPYVKPSRPDIPAITGTGRAVWIQKKFQIILRDQKLSIGFERFIKDWCENNTVYKDIIKKTTDWINWDKYNQNADKMAHEWFVLGNQDALAQLYAAMASEWWGLALIPIEKKECTHDDKKTEWRDLCQTFGFPSELFEFDPTDCWEKKRAFYKKMGWKF